MNYNTQQIDRKKEYDKTTVHLSNNFYNLKSIASNEIP